MPSPQEREEALFRAAVELTPDAARRDFLDQVCAGDAALRARLEALLAAHHPPAAPPAPNAPAVKATLKLDLPDAEDEALGTRISHYKLLERVGEGGCGVVYVAEQTEPVRRRVALKVIKLGMDTKQVVARFEGERQALAMMDHPNIAKVLDGGSTETGRPYFVMELVRGIRITDYCDQHHLPTPARLDLFIQVCHAIQHAHQKGIIHRDIKPSNILVTLHDGVPVPKVIDFGIAKATTGQRLTDKTLFTAFEQFMGTPAYMSPEQAEMSGLDIDTRSDIYSLGVLLYELLAGSTPFDAKELMASGIDAMRKTIREKEPVRPSTKLTRELVAADVSPRKSTSGLAVPTQEEVSADSRRRLRLKEQIARVKGDLDWIVMKCLEKDRQRRYESASGLAADILRHLNNQPVAARPPSTAYRLQKAWRRNKVVYSAGMTVAAALLIGIMFSSWQASVAIRAQRETEKARTAEQAQRVEAQAAQRTAEIERARAEAEALESRRRTYAADVNLAQHAIEVGNIGRALELLNGQVPPANQLDLRGWEWRYLRQQCQSEALATFLVLSNASVYALAVSKDGRWLAVLATDQRILLWDLAGRTLAEQFNIRQFPRSAAFSGSSSLLAFACELDSPTGRTIGIRVWDLQRRRIVTEFPTGKRVPVGLAFSQDEKQLLSVEWDGVVQRWQIPEGREISLKWEEGIFQEQAPGPRAAIHEESGLVAKGSYAGFRVLDVRAGRELWSANKSSAAGWAGPLTISDDARVLAFAGGEFGGPITFFEASTGRLLTQLQGHQSGVFDLLFTPKSEWLASASTDHTIRIWDLRNLSQVPPARVLRGHKQEVWALALLNDGRTLVSGSKDGEVCLWDSGSNGPVPMHHTMNLSTNAFGRFSTDGRSVQLLNPRHSELCDWDGQQISNQRRLAKLEPDFRQARWSPDGRRLAAAYTNGSIQVWDVQALKPLADIRAFTNKPTVVQFDKTGKHLAVLDGREVAIWDVERNAKVTSHTLPKDVQLFTGGLQTLSSDLSWAVITEELPGSMAEGELFSLMELAAGKQRPLGTVFGCNGVAISADDTLVACPSVNGYVRVWDTRTCNEAVTLKGFLNAVASAAFSPDGSRLATGTGGDGLIRMWDTATWRELVTLKTGDDWVLHLEFSPDGNGIRAVGETKNRTGHLWRAPSYADIAAAEAKEKAEIKKP